MKCLLDIGLTIIRSHGVSDAELTQLSVFASKLEWVVNCASTN